MKFLSQNGVSSMASDVTVILLLVLLTVFTAAVCIVLLCRFADGEPVRRPKGILAIILAGGFVIRLIFALTVRGYRGDYSLISDMIAHLEKSGLKGYYKGDASAVLYPVTYFVYLIFGGLSNAMGLSDFPLGLQFMIKLPLISADLLAAFAIYITAKRYFNTRSALVLAGLVCACPIFFIGSAVWTTTSVFTVMFACFCCYFMSKKQCGLTVLFATLAAFSGKEGIYLFPAVAAFSVYHIVRAAMNIKAADDNSDILSVDKRAVITVPCAFVLSLAAVYLIGLFMTASYSCNIFKHIYEFLLAPLVSWEYFTYNGTSVYAMFGQNGETASARFPSGLFAGMFSAIIVAVVCVVYFSKRNRATMVMLAAYSVFTLGVYYPGSTAITMTCALLLVLISFAMVKDKRLLTVVFLSGFAFVLNAMSALANAGYINDLADYAFTSADYTGSTLLTGGVGAVNIICAVITVLTHIYYTAVTVNVGMTGNRKLLNKQDDIKSCFKEYFTGGENKSVS